MPIVGPVKTANDTFVQQVQMNARAAVKVLEEAVCVDCKRSPSQATATARS
jgi:hypothetical protein